MRNGFFFFNKRVAFAEGFWIWRYVWLLMVVYGMRCFFFAIEPLVVKDITKIAPLLKILKESLVRSLLTVFASVSFFLSQH